MSTTTLSNGDELAWERLIRMSLSSNHHSTFTGKTSAMLDSHCCQYQPGMETACVLALDPETRSFAICAAGLDPRIFGDNAGRDVLSRLPTTS